MLTSTTTAALLENPPLILSCHRSLLPLALRPFLLEKTRALCPKRIDLCLPCLPLDPLHLLSEDHPLRNPCDLQLSDSHHPFLRSRWAEAPASVHEVAISLLPCRP